MIRCKKYKAQFSANTVNHHRNPKGDCENCVYFSKQNCGNHAYDAPTAVL